MSKQLSLYCIERKTFHGTYHVTFVTLITKDLSETFKQKMAKMTKKGDEVKDH